MNEDAIAQLKHIYDHINQFDNNIDLCIQHVTNLINSLEQMKTGNFDERSEK